MNNYPKYKVALFDLDGTLNDSAPGIMRCFRLGLARFGITENDDMQLKRVIGPPLVYSYREFYGLDEEQAQEAVRIYRADYSVQGYKEGRIYDGVREMLKALKDAGVRSAVVTSKPEKFACGVIEYNGLDDLFETVVGPGMTETDPGKAKLIERALEKMGVKDKSTVCMTGDRNYDMKGAADAGVTGFGALWGFGDRQELESAGACEVVRDASTLTGLILGNK